METQYLVLHRPRHDDQAATETGRYPSLAEAMLHTDHASADDWAMPPNRDTGIAP